MQSKPESEKLTEKYLVESVAKLGGIPYKLAGTGRKGAPDRLCVMPFGYSFFVEVKSEGQLPKPWQVREIDRLNSMEHPVFVADTKAKVDAIMKAYKNMVTGGKSG